MSHLNRNEFAALAQALEPAAGDSVELLLAKLVESMRRPVTLAGESVTATAGKHYLATAANTVITIPETAPVGFVCSVEAGCEGTVALGTAGAAWYFLYPGGRYLRACAVQGVGGVIRAEVIAAGVIAVSGSGLPYNPGWLPHQAGANCLYVGRAGSHHPWDDYGGSQGGGDYSTGQSLGAGRVQRWGGLYGNGGALVFDPAEGDVDTYAPLAEADPAYTFGQSIRFREAAGAGRVLTGTPDIVPAAGAFTLYMGWRNRGLPASSSPAMIITMGGANAQAGAFGWGAMKQGLIMAGGAYGLMWHTSVNAGAYASKPAAADFTTNENTLSPRLVSVEVTAGGVGDVYVGETKVSIGASASGAFTPEYFKLNPATLSNFSVIGIFQGIPADATQRALQQRYFMGLAS